MPTIQSKIIQDSERIVILYANYSGRESEHRGKFRIEVEKILQELVDSRDAQIAEMLENAKVDLTSIKESIATGMDKIEEKLLEMHAIGCNTALDDAIKSLKDSK